MCRSVHVCIPTGDRGNENEGAREAPELKKVLTVKNGAAFAVVVALCVIAALAAPDADPAADPVPWYSILPPLLAVTLAIVTGRILASLVLAIAIGGLLNTVPDAPLSIAAWAKGLGKGFGFVWISVSDPTNLQILAFVLLVLAMIAVVITAGGLQGIVVWLSRFARGPRSAQFVTFLMGLVIFIDDYANTMIVGAAMRPVTDRLRVSREKLSFLVDATSAPIAGLAVVSTWVGYEVGLFGEAADSLGIDATGYSMLFDAIVYRFYCVLMICFVFMNVVSGKDFGPMRKAEKRCRETGAVAEANAIPMTSKAFSTADPHPDARIRAMTGVIPIAALFFFLLGGIWIDGGGRERLADSAFALFRFSDWREVIGASENSIAILALSAAFSLALAILCARVLSKTRIYAIVPAILSGAKSSLLPIVILLLAWSLKEACTSLGTGPFLVAAVGDALSSAWFPALTFILAGLTSFATGTSYGTMAILMPTAVPIAFHLEGGTYGPITIITLAAILDGSIFGDHCSPISDTTIMSSISSSSDHLHHVKTQLPYSLTVGLLALVCGYIPAGFGAPPWAGFLAAIVAMVLLFAVLPKERGAQ